MTLDYLKEFEIIVRLGSFTKASEELNLSQSALSKHIAALERELDVTLFDRSARAISITDGGRILLGTAEKIDKILDELDDNLIPVRRDEQSTIIIGSQTSLNHCGVLDAILRFKALHPDIRVIANDRVMGMLNPFSDQDIDLAFCRRIPNFDDKYDYTLYQRDRLSLIVSENSPLAKKGQITWPEIKNMEILCSSENIKSVLLEKAHDYGFEPKLTMMGNTQMGSIFEYVRLSDAATLSGRLIYEGFKVTGTVPVDIVPIISRDLYLAKPKRASLSRGCKLFWKFIQENYSQANEKNNQS